jgi:hypothetical protein
VLLCALLCRDVRYLTCILCGYVLCSWFRCYERWSDVACGTLGPVGFHLSRCLLSCAFTSLFVRFRFVVCSVLCAVLWCRVESFADSFYTLILQIWTLQRVLAKKKDPHSHQLFLHVYNRALHSAASASASTASATAKAGAAAKSGGGGAVQSAEKKQTQQPLRREEKEKVFFLLECLLPPIEGV